MVVICYDSGMSLFLSLTSAAILFASSAGAPAAPALPPASSTKPTAGAHAAPQGALPWIEDDYARAVAEGKRRGVPVFVEAWAPW